MIKRKKKDNDVILENHGKRMSMSVGTSVVKIVVKIETSNSRNRKIAVSILSNFRNIS